MRIDRSLPRPACPSPCPQMCQNPTEIRQLAALGLASPYTTRLQLISLPCLSALASNPADKRRIQSARRPTSPMAHELAVGLGTGLYLQAPPKRLTMTERLMVKPSEAEKRSGECARPCLKRATAGAASQICLPSGQPQVTSPTSLCHCNLKTCLPAAWCLPLQVVLLPLRALGVRHPRARHPMTPPPPSPPLRVAPSLPSNPLAAGLSWTTTSPSHVSPGHQALLPWAQAQAQVRRSGGGGSLWPQQQRARMQVEEAGACMSHSRCVTAV